MKKVFMSLSVIASLYGVTVSSNTTSNFSFLTNTNNFFGEVQNAQYTNVSMNEAKFSNEDNQKEVEFIADPSRCFNAFSIPDPSNLSNSPVSILTQIQNNNFYLKIVRKHTAVCSDISDVNITLIDKDGNEIDYDKSSLNPITEPSDYGYIVTPMQFNVHNAYRDVFVHFSYKIKNKEVGCATSAYINASSDDKFKVEAGVSAKCYLKTTAYTKEENATDDFAVRPKQFNILANSTVYVRQPLHININVDDGNGNIATNYSNKDTNLNTIITDSNTALSYYYDIFQGKLGNHRFIFKKPSDDVKIQISEKLGKEWAIVDADDTKDTRRLITPGESNSIKVLETSKNWAGAGTGATENSASSNSINTDIRDNTDRNLKFNKMNW